MPRVPDEIAVYIFLTGGQRECVKFPTMQSFQKWYQGVLVPKAESNEFINVPIKTVQDEYMVLRPSSVLAIRLEPIFASSNMDRDQMA